MVIPALRHKTHGIGGGLQQAGQAGIVRSRNARALCHAESGKFGPRSLAALEEGRIGRIGARIAALDIINTKLFEQHDDRFLVFYRKVNAGRLLSIPEGRVVDIDALACHYLAPAFWLDNNRPFNICPSSHASRLRAGG